MPGWKLDRLFLACSLVCLITGHSVAQAVGGDTTSHTLELPGYWGHLNYTITGARLTLKGAKDEGFIGFRTYEGQISGTTLTITGTGVSDNPSPAGQESGFNYQLRAKVTVGSETREFFYPAQADEKLNKSYSLTLPVKPGASGNFEISLIYKNAYYGDRGWRVTGTFLPLALVPVAVPPKPASTPAAPSTATPEPEPPRVTVKLKCRGRFGLPPVSAEVSGTPRSDSEWTLHESDWVKTGEEACSLEFSDGSVLYLDRGSKIHISNEPFEGKPYKPGLLKLMAGKIFGKTPHDRRSSASPDRVITTGHGVVLIKGTTYAVETSGLATTLFVLEGQVQFRSPGSAETVLVKTGESLSVTDQGLGSTTTFDVDKAQARWDVILGRFRQTEPAESTVPVVDLGNVFRRAVSLAPPKIPAMARAVGITNESVIVEVFVDPEGNVTAAKAIAGHPLLRSAAEDAARLARFTPLIRNGKAVPFKGTITYAF